MFMFYEFYLQEFFLISVNFFDQNQFLSFLLLKLFMNPPSDNSLIYFTLQSQDTGYGDITSVGLDDHW